MISKLDRLGRNLLHLVNTVQGPVGPRRGPAAAHPTMGHRSTPRPRPAASCSASSRALAQSERELIRDRTVAGLKAGVSVASARIEAAVVRSDGAKNAVERLYLLAHALLNGLPAVRCHSSVGRGADSRTTGDRRSHTKCPLHVRRRERHDLSVLARPSRRHATQRGLAVPKARTHRAYQHSFRSQPMRSTQLAVALLLTFVPSAHAPDRAIAYAPPVLQAEAPAFLPIAGVEPAPSAHRAFGGPIGRNSAVDVEALRAAETNSRFDLLQRTRRTTPGQTLRANAQLPPDILVDRLLIRVERLLEEGNTAAAHDVMNEIVALQHNHDLVLPENFYFHYARLAYAVDQTEAALPSLNQYLLVAGRDGEFYREALELLDSAERRLRRAEAAAPRIDAELRRAQALQRESDELRRRQAEAATRTLRDPLRSGGDGPRMVTVAAGRFQLSVFDDNVDRLSTTRWMEFDRDFAMSQYEVTRGDFQRFVDRTRYRTEAERGERFGCLPVDLGPYSPRPVWPQVESSRIRTD